MWTKWSCPGHSPCHYLLFFQFWQTCWVCIWLSCNRIVLQLNNDGVIPIHLTHMGQHGSSQNDCPIRCFIMFYHGLSCFWHGFIILYVHLPWLILVYFMFYHIVYSLYSWFDVCFWIHICPIKHQHHFKGCLPWLPQRSVAKVRWCCWRPRTVAAGRTRQRPSSAWAEHGEEGGTLVVGLIWTNND